MPVTLWTITDRDLTSAPSSPAADDVYIVGPSATGDWLSQDGKIALFIIESPGDPPTGEWKFFPGEEGWLAWIKDENVMLLHDGTSWHKIVTEDDAPIISYHFGKNSSGLTTGQYLQVGPGNIDSQWRGYRAPFDLELFYIGGETAGTVTDVDFEVRADGVAEYTLNVTANGAIDHDLSTPDTGFDKGDEIQVYMNPKGGSDSVNIPHINCYFRKRTVG